MTLKPAAALTAVITSVIAAAPFAVGGIDHRWVTAHIVISVVIAVVYEAVLAAVTTTARFAGRALAIPRDRLADRLGIAIFEEATRRISRYERDYLASLGNLTQFTDNTSLLTFGTRPTELDDVYIDVSIDGNVSPGRSPEGLLSGSGQADAPDPAQRMSVWDFIGTRRRGPALHVILGAPGSGKSTLLQHIARRPYDPRRPHRGRMARGRMALPVLLPLRTCATAITADPAPDLPALIGGHAEGLTGGPPPPGWFRKQLQAGRCVVMFDGLDEVPGRADRRAVLDWLHTQIARYRDNDFLLTSRPRSYRQEHSRAAYILQVREFTPAQVGAFVHRWYRAAVRQDVIPGGDHDVSGQADDLIARITDSGLADLAANPLLLTMMASVHLYTGKLPTTRNKLYAEMCRVVTERRQLPAGEPPAGEPPAPMPAEKKELVLRQLAFAMMTSGKPTMSGQRAATAIRRVLHREAPGLDPGDFLAHVRLTGLLVAGDAGDYSFAHVTFREYLAAMHIAATRQVRKLIRTVGNPDWRETTLFYAAHAGAGAIVQACLDSGRVAALALAFDCAEEDDALDPGLRGQLDELLSDASDPAAAADRRDLAAAVIATRELRQTVRLAKNLTVCAAPVSRQLYELFRSQAQARYPVRADGPARAREIAVGVPAPDAVAFPGWLNGIIVGLDQARYRLPTRAESGIPGFPGNPAPSQHCVWLAPSGQAGEPDLWVPAGARHPYLVTGRQLAERVAADLAGPAGVAAAAMLAFALAHTLSVIDTLAGSVVHPAPRLGVVERREERDRVVALCRELVEAVEPDPSSAARMALDSVLNDALTRALRRDLVSGLIHGTAGDPKPPERVTALAFEHAWARAVDLGQALDAALRRALGRRFGLVLPRSGAKAGEVGRALGAALDADLDQALSGDFGLDLPICLLFARPGSFARPGLGDGPDRVVTPALTRQCEHDARRGLEALAPTPGLAHLHARTIAVAHRVEHILAASGDPVQAGDACYVRLGSLAVAAAAGRLGADPAVAEGYADVAAGVTALEARALGLVPPSEVIVLVRA